jgi:hypothetical protein
LSCPEHSVPNVKFVAPPTKTPKKEKEIMALIKYLKA